MYKEYLISKIHKATVTQADLEYVGSVTIDQDLLDMVGLEDGQKVTIVSNTSGARLETYVLLGERGSGVICINGAASHLIKAGEEVIIISYAMSKTRPTPKCIWVDKNNKFIKYLVEKEKTTPQQA